MNNETISSLQNPGVKAAVRLRQRRGRKQAGRILIDGVREIGRALQAGVAVGEVFFCCDLLESDAGGEIVADARSERESDAGGERAERAPWPQLLEDARRGGACVIGVTALVFGKIGYGQRADGMVAVADRPACDLAELSVGEASVVAVVDHVEKPGNLGAILRTADAAGVEAILAVDAAVDVYGPNVIRASLGTVFCVPMVETGAEAARAWLRQGRFRVVAAHAHGETDYAAVDYRGRTAIVLGSESRGLGANWGGGDVIRAAVPMRGRSDSLNVSTTAALFFYEALRQRGTQAQAGSDSD